MASRSYTDIGAVQRPASPTGADSYSAPDIGAVQREAAAAAAAGTIHELGPSGVSGSSRWDLRPAS